MIGLLYMTYPNACRHMIFIPVEAKVLLGGGGGALALVLAIICVLL